MKNKIKLKRYLAVTFVVSICLVLLSLALSNYEYQTYTNNFNSKIEAIVTLVKNKYPQTTDKELIEILNSDIAEPTDFFKKYGIDINKDSAALQNSKAHGKFLVCNALFMLAAISALLTLFMTYNHKKETGIKDIIRYIEQINRKNYELQIDSISEDELSILKNEIYKTTIMLKEAAENSLKDKISLKKSLEDISHQLKTPLTSILVALDNIIDDPDMDASVRSDFIRDAKRNVTNINFLVQSLLKLSKFDSNTVNFVKKKHNLKDIVDESVKNVSTLCDLRDISIKFGKICTPEIKCDSKWQTEAITNILKNSIDHSRNGSEIVINLEDSNVYSAVEITDNGNGINEKDLPHIFERFYKGETSNSDSVGIGLALAKSIVEKDGGSISAESSKTKTKFTLKYFKL